MIIYYSTILKKKTNIKTSKKIYKRYFIIKSIKIKLLKEYRIKKREKKNLDQ